MLTTQSIEIERDEEINAVDINVLTTQLIEIERDVGTYDLSVKSINSET